VLSLLMTMQNRPSDAPPPATQPTQFAQRTVTFDHPDGPYTNDMVRADFGNGGAPAQRNFGEIVDGTLKVTFKAGVKVNGTGFSPNVRIPARPSYTVSFRIRFDEHFEAGLHGKQIGLSGGRGYTGGRGQEARDNGDGWSVRLQFDSRDDAVTNLLYVYHSQMKGTYGEPLSSRNQRFAMKRGEWHEIRLRATAQSDVSKPDGRIEVWCNGQKTIDVNDIPMVREESGRNVNMLRFEIFPGGGGATPTRDSYLYIDDVSWTDE
jgi:hypothetical protein